MPRADACATQRLFFALWPDDALRQRLHQLGRQVVKTNGRLVVAENLHLTLAFIGPVSPSVRDCMRAAVADLHAAPFELQLDRVGHWPRPRVLWFGGDTPVALAGLVQALNTALAACGYVPEPRAFVPHVTLARKAAAMALQTVAPIHWAVRDFCLVESSTQPQGPVYTVLQRWPLGG